MASTFEEARNSIGKYCYSECRAYCCRKGQLTVTEKEAELICKGEISKFIGEGRICVLENGRFLIDLNKTCPALDGFKCILHKDPNRPKACRDFPIFLEKNNVNISEGCYAVLDGLLYTHIGKMKREGYTVDTFIPRNKRN